MARRRPVAQVRTGAAPPDWTKTYSKYLKHLGVDLADGVPLEHWREWHDARDQWCAENSCCRAGTKTCLEVYGRTCRWIAVT